MIQTQLINDSYLQWLPIEDYKLNDDEIHLWQIELPTMSHPARFEKLHALKIKRRELLIQVLSNYLNPKIDNNDFELLSSGKPYLKHHSLQFNTTHTKNLLLVAIHKNLPLGIDVEWMRKRSIQDFSERFWGEQWYLKNIKPVIGFMQKLCFFQAWTGTEAWVKALGQTIFNHQELPVSGFPAQQSLMHENWQFKYFMPYPNMVACLCCHQNIKKVFFKKIIIEDYE